MLHVTSYTMTCYGFHVMKRIFFCSLYHSSKPDDQDNVEDILSGLPPSHHWHLQKAREEGDELVLVHQTSEQQRLLKKYGNEICLLDATHKTSKYSLPLFLVVVKTNTVYQVVASFLVSSESAANITKALEKLREFNQQWNPKYWMSDLCYAEIGALEKVFPGKYNYHKESNTVIHVYRPSDWPTCITWHNPCIS